ncbi:MAG: UbiX family flavin prenyltransferase [Holophagaceae bacterium]|nr:UbiX family flavin prenyltransferase [Holophagaceae bacterium]
MNAKNRIIIAITGASGTPFAYSLLRRAILEPSIEQIFIISSMVGRKCLLDETGVDFSNLSKETKKICLIDEQCFGAEISSGSAPHRGMVIIPCSAGTLGRIASGTSNNLISRAADVCLKERRPLILCIRETPMNRIHINNMLNAHDAGATIMPLLPTFYHHPTTIEDLCDAFATRILDQLGIFQEDSRRWKGEI